MRSDPEARRRGLADHGGPFHPRDQPLRWWAVLGGGGAGALAPPGLEISSPPSPSSENCYCHHYLLTVTCVGFLRPQSSNTQATRSKQGHGGKTWISVLPTGTTPQMENPSPLQPC